ncbi:MAG: hypothetical protein JETT_3199 [Candidatus Jettenia ecosi]|uniref:SpoVT-AbrB domain-containing protein n=1 Tax=Candidatus Jettenia ecosi TaxID=2494326 RepID=A0A533Q7G3_9BACT|nr:MAG: hypothetical protein JETT_3199 [Candidatus Jettenia ecosi]
MGNKATYTAEYLDDGHLSIPKEIVDRLSLKKGKKLRVIVEASRFDKKGILDLFGVWREKNAEEIKIFKDILEERNHFGRGEIKL